MIHVHALCFTAISSLLANEREIEAVYIYTILSHMFVSIQVQITCKCLFSDAGAQSPHTSLTRNLVVVVQSLYSTVDSTCVYCTL